MVAPTDVERIIHGFNPGDNCVFRIDEYDLGSFVPFARRLAEDAARKGRRCVYFRFGSHAPLCEASDGVIIEEVNPAAGFENFITSIHRRIKATGKGAYYLFDALSELSSSCYSDRMIGNFFMLTCPYLHEHETIAYFVLYRHRHSYHAVTPITETVQVLLDLYTCDGTHYLKPFKAEGRRSKTMFTLHEWAGGEWRAVLDSARIARVIQSSPWPGLPSTSYRMIGVWDRELMGAERAIAELNEGRMTREQERSTLHRILRLIVSQDERIFALAAEHLTISDVVAIWKRMIGTGLIGGKSVGMLLARAILGKRDPKWRALLEEHDSFFIGSDVFYTFLVINKCWWARQRQKDPRTFLDDNDDVRRRIMGGEFPDYILMRFADMLDYFGQSPIIVRSSSLLEDNYGNAFAGKYESVFCANQGTKEERMAALLKAVRTVYASTMSDDALEYRKQRGMLDRDEQMALLVQRVSGASYGRFFFPQLAGVGYSFNAYAWSREIDPRAGVVRLVFGLGTRAVDRSDEDYTRVVALNAPERRPEASREELRRYAQREVDLLNLDENRFERLYFSELCESIEDRELLERVATRDRDEESERRRPTAHRGERWLLTFERLLRESTLVAELREMLATLREAYGSEVDVEFTANFLPDGSHAIDVLQCRPFQIRADSTRSAAGELERQAAFEAERLESEANVVLRANGGVVGLSRTHRVDWIVYVDPDAYGALALADRMSVARVVTDALRSAELAAGSILLIGPGRWGTSSAELGVPIASRDIGRARVVCEIDSMHAGLVPDLSIGTHFFNELVEMELLYIAYFTRQAENRLDVAWLRRAPSGLHAVAAGAERWRDVVRVIDARPAAAAMQGESLVLSADATAQSAALYRVPARADG